MGELVYGYLQHHGHWETAAAVGRDVLGGAVSVSQADIADARRRALPMTRSLIISHESPVRREACRCHIHADWCDCFSWLRF